MMQHWAPPAFPLWLRILQTKLRKCLESNSSKTARNPSTPYKNPEEAIIFNNPHTLKITLSSLSLCQEVLEVLEDKRNRLDCTGLFVLVLNDGKWTFP